MQECRSFETVKGTCNYNQYAFILQTGLRTGEMIGLRWSGVDFEKRVLHIRRTMEYRHSVGEWRIWEPKIRNSIRDVLMTEEAVEIKKTERKAKILENQTDRV